MSNLIFSSQKQPRNKEQRNLTRMPKKTTDKAKNLGNDSSPQNLKNERKMTKFETTLSERKSRTAKLKPKKNQTNVSKKKKAKP